MVSETVAAPPGTGWIGLSWGFPLTRLLARAMYCLARAVVGMATQVIATWVVVPCLWAGHVAVAWKLRLLVR
jgi:hypothetical protein